MIRTATPTTVEESRRTSVSFVSSILFLRDHLLVGPQQHGNNGSLQTDAQTVTDTTDQTETASNVLSTNKEYETSSGMYAAHHRLVYVILIYHVILYYIDCVVLYTLYTLCSLQTL